jgi:Phage T7 capsid assembly protein
MADMQSVSIDTSKDVANPTLEQEAAEQAKADAAATAAADKGKPADDRPDWLPEKFKAGADLAKAYEELEKKLGANKPADDAKPADDKKPEEKSAEEQARDATKSAGLDFDKLSDSYWEKGALADTEYAQLEKAGIPKHLVDSFIAGQQALVDNTRNNVFNSVGGEESYNSITEWAAENYTPEEIAAFNKTVNGTDATATLLAVKGLKARYDATVGFEPADAIKGETAVKRGQPVYRSIAEMEKDMGDPRYQKDPAFRRDVEQKLARSDIM